MQISKEIKEKLDSEIAKMDHYCSAKTKQRILVTLLKEQQRPKFTPAIVTDNV